MALGKNINLNKSTDSNKSGNKKSSLKKDIEKKKLIAKKPAKKIVSPKKSIENPILQYLTEETQKKKTELRKRYTQEITELKERLCQVIVFKIGDDEFAIDIGLIKEVVPFSSLAKFPKAPIHVKGATIVRGQTITAIDLQSKFKKEESSDYAFTIALKNKNKVGLLVSELPLAMKVKGSKIDGDLSSLESAIEDETFIKGIIEHNERLIFYLDIDGLIDGDKTIVVPNEIVKKS